jgi:hypothetical protein
MPDFVHMHHPDVDACAEAPEAAFEAVWAEKGWTVVEPHDTEDVDLPQAPVEASLTPKPQEASGPPPAPVKPEPDTAKEN